MKAAKIVGADPAFSNRCLDAARRAWTAANRNPELARFDMPAATSRRAFRGSERSGDVRRGGEDHERKMRSTNVLGGRYSRFQPQRGRDQLECTARVGLRMAGRVRSKAGGALM